ncbi:MAG: energy-coupling factor ABC transporter permease [Methanobacterium sp.]
MHLPDGLIPLWQSVIYWILAIIVLALYLFKLSKSEEKEKITINTAILAAVTIAVSSLSIPSPFGVPLHLFVIPLVVILLGPLSGVAVAFLCLVVQFFLLGFGGITTLGANTLSIGVALSFSTYIFYKLLSGLDERMSIFSGTLMGIVIAALAQVVIIMVAGAGTLEMLMAALIPFYLFIGVIEGVSNVFIISFISKVKPELLKTEKI